MRLVYLKREQTHLSFLYSKTAQISILNTISFCVYPAPRKCVQCKILWCMYPAPGNIETCELFVHCCVRLTSQLDMSHVIRNRPRLSFLYLVFQYTPIIRFFGGNKKCNEIYVVYTWCWKRCLFQHSGVGQLVFC